jgi:hypothetical protein
MTKRAETEKFIIEHIEMMIPGSDNKKIYENLFKSMDDEAFDNFMKGLENETIKLSIIAPNFSKHKLNTSRNLAIGKKLGLEYFQKIWIDGTEGRPSYLTPIPYMVVDLPLRRQAQLLVKKISIPEDNKSIDNMTGQPVGNSKGSKISYPETQVLAAMKLDNSIVELLKYRGGDIGGFQAMNKLISRNGGASIETAKQYATGVESTRTLKTFLTCMHLGNTL